MKNSILVVVGLLINFLGYAQQSGADKGDTWSNVPTATDDRFTNPKSKLYAGPNGWYNFGEVRAVVSNAAKTSYSYKGGFTTNSNVFNVVEPNKNRVLNLDFGTERPPVGSYQISKEANLAQKKVHLSFADISNSKLLDWDSADNTGTVTVSLVNGFLYVKCRNVQLQPAGLHNTGDMKSPMTLGFEGAISPQ